MSYHYEGKFIKVKSDYDPDTYMKIHHNSEGDVVFKIRGNGEMRIALSGGQFHGKKLCAIIDAVKALMDAISMEEEAPAKNARWSDASPCDGCCHKYGCGRITFDTFGMSEEEIFEQHCVGCACGDGYDCNRGNGCDNYEDGTEPLLG